MALVLSSAPAQAVFVEFSYTGTVQNDPLADVRIGSPFDGDSQSPYTGPDFDFPFGVGHLLTFTYSAFLNLNAIPPPPDNIYRFSPAGINASIGLRTIGGQGSSAPQYGAGPFPLGGGISFLYDANDGVANDQRLSIDLSSGNDLRDTVRMPGFRYDQASNTITPGPAGRCDDFDREGCANISIGTTAMTISNNFILGQVDPLKPPFRAGSFGDIQLNGQWSVPVIGGDPVDVPAPPVLLLFGLGAGALVWRKRKLNK